MVACKKVLSRAKTLLARKEQSAIIGPLAHPTIPEAAKAAGICEATLGRWLQSDDFRDKYTDAQSKVFDGALVSLQGATMDAVNVFIVIFFIVI